jgi:hypothetical protein
MPPPTMSTSTINHALTTTHHSINHRPYKRLLSSAEVAALYFKRFDSDKDGALSFEEFERLCRSTKLR